MSTLLIVVDLGFIHIALVIEDLVRLDYFGASPFDRIDLFADQWEGKGHETGGEAMRGALVAGYETVSILEPTA